MQILIQLMMEVGTLQYLQEPLWAIIRDLKTSDDIKDSANLVLRHLGDPTDPDLYLEYLSDPEGLINRETIRMLNVSSENPEALIDFIDFILSLTEDDQIRMLSALEEDYPPGYLVNLYLPMLESDPSPALWEQIIDFLGQSKSVEAARTLERLSQWPEERLPVSVKLVQKALKQLQLAGIKTHMAALADTHALVKESDPYECFATITDGIGNQGLIFSRKRQNGDISMMSVALNDIHGIIDCFGFYQIGLSDFHRIVDKFHESTTKINVTPEYCAYKLSQAIRLNESQHYRIPYEFRCWQPLLSDIESQPLEDLPKDWIRKEWFAETGNLYQHPDFKTWFLEQGDEPIASPWLKKVAPCLEKILAQPEPTSNNNIDVFCHELENIADNMVRVLLDSDWQNRLISRLSEAAYLLNCQNTQTFRNMAATEAYKLKTVSDVTVRLLGFPRMYGRRCIAEELLRLQSTSTQYETISAISDVVLTRWQI
jgi:hypothetical protein